jgi:hypothetical protein
MSEIDREFIAHMGEAVQQVRLTEDQARVLAEVISQQNAAVLAAAVRLPFESEPSAFIRLLHEGRAREEAP